MALTNTCPVSSARLNPSLLSDALDINSDPPSSVGATLVVALGFVAAPGDSADICRQSIEVLTCCRNLSKQTD